MRYSWHDASRLIVVFIAFILVVSGHLTMGVHAQDDEEIEPGWCVSAWFPSSDYPDGFAALMAQVESLDEVNPFWYTPLPNGEVQPTPEAENADQLAAWRDADLRIVPSIFSSIFIMIEDPDVRETHIAAIVDLVVIQDYDGIDIDYEGFAAHTREDFSLFIEGLAEALHAEDRLLSVTVHAKTDDAGAWSGAQAQDWPRLAASADVFRIMTYDFTNRNEPPGPISPVGWVLDVLAYADSVTDLQKVRMGLHFYGYSWQRGTPPAQTVNWAGIQNWIENLGAEVQRDPDSYEAFIDFKVTGLPRQVVYFADGDGLAFKLEQIVAAYPALGGVSIWGIGGEDPTLWDVLQPYIRCDE